MKLGPEGTTNCPSRTNGPGSLGACLLVFLFFFNPFYNVLTGKKMGLIMWMGLHGIRQQEDMDGSCITIPLPISSTLSIPMLPTSCGRKNALRSSSILTQEQLRMGFYTQELGKKPIWILIPMWKWGEVCGWISWNGKSMKIFVSHVNVNQRPFILEEALNNQVDKMTHSVNVS